MIVFLLHLFLVILQIRSDPDLDEILNINISPAEEEASLVQEDQTCPVCQPETEVFLNLEKIKSDIFNLLSSEVYQQVIEFLRDNLPIVVNLLREDGSYEWPPPAPYVDQLADVEAYPVPKQEALDYLDGNGPRPQQYALATVLRGSRNPPDVVEYKVGPFPINENTTTVQTVPDGTIPWKKHPFSQTQLAYQAELINKAAYGIREIFKYATGGFCVPYYPYIGDDTPGEECGFIDRFRWLEYPVLNFRDRRLGRIFFHFQADYERHGDGLNLHPVPITFVVDSSEPNYTNWQINNFVYCHQGPFKTAEELLTKFRSGSIKRCQPAEEWGTIPSPFHDHHGSPPTDHQTDDSQIYDSRWSELYNESIYSLYGRSPQNGQASPRTLMPQGARFKILGESSLGRRITWLDWEAHIVLKGRLGPALYDIKFRGERIVYELALQEQYVAYTGYGGMGQLMYLDSYFQLGSSASVLRRGYDCPEHAVYLPVQKISPLYETYEQSDSICVFEADSQIPLWRHYQSYLDTVFVGRDSHLVIRLVLTIENYDYVYSIIFSRAGSIHVKVDMNGYVSSSFFDPQGGTWQSGNMGTRIHKYTFANLHDHLSSWKVDLDVKGMNNSFLRYTEKSGTYSEAIEQFTNYLQQSPTNGQIAEKAGFIQAVDNVIGLLPLEEIQSVVDANGLSSLGSLEELNDQQLMEIFPGWFESQTTKFVEMQIEEEEAGFKLNYENPSIYQIINENHINQWGNPKGLSIKFDSTIGQVLPENHPYLKAAAWAKYHLAVTKRKEVEQSAMATQYDWYLPGNPIVSLDNYINGENIRDEDLVLWIMTGVQHLPRSEDIPLVAAISAGFHIEPRNYFDHMPGINGYERPDIKIGCVPDLQAGSAEEAFEEEISSSEIGIPLAENELALEDSLYDY